MTDEQPADAARMRAEGLQHIRRGRAMVRAAENLGATAEPQPRGGTDSVDFGALPGRSPEARAEALYFGRRMRDGMFPQGIFGEPAWDIMLAVFLAQSTGMGFEVETVVRECRITSEAGERYVALLVKLDLLEERQAAQSQPHLALSAEGLRLIRRFFELTDGSSPVSRKAFTPSFRLMAGSDTPTR